MNKKKIMWILLLAIIIVVCGVVIFKDNKKDIKESDESKINIVVSNFASYDFLRCDLMILDDIFQLDI